MYVVRESRVEKSRQFCAFIGAFRSGANPREGAGINYRALL